MSSVRGKNNRAEVALRKALWRRGFRYRLYAKDLPGTPDIVFRRHKLAVFVDGDFWHGRVLRERGPGALAASIRTERRDYWIAKIEKNAARDITSVERLEALKYAVLRFWERDILKDVTPAVVAVEAFFKDRS